MGESIWLQSIINQRTTDSNHTSSPTAEVSFKAWYCKIQFLDALGTLLLTWGCSWRGEPGMWTIHLGFPPLGTFRNRAELNVREENNCSCCCLTPPPHCTPSLVQLTAVTGVHLQYSSLIKLMHLEKLVGRAFITTCWKHV